MSEGRYSTGSDESELELSVLKYDLTEVKISLSGDSDGANVAAVDLWTDEEIEEDEDAGHRVEVISDVSDEID